MGTGAADFFIVCDFKEAGFSNLHCARKWRAQRGRPPQGVSEARAAVRGRPETDWTRVFTRDDSIDVLARAVRSGAAHDGATEEIPRGCAESDLGGLNRRRCRDDVRGKV